MKLIRIHSNNLKPAFGAKINGDVALKICKEMYGNKLNKYETAYVNRYQALRKAGSESSEIYISRGAGDRCAFNLRNKELTEEYEIPLEETKVGHLLEAWFKIKPEDIEKAEVRLRELINRRKRFE